MSLQGKTMMSDNFELWGEGEMEPTSSVTFSTSLRITWSLGCTSQNRRAFVYKADNPLISELKISGTTSSLQRHCNLDPGLDGVALLIPACVITT